MSREPNDQPLRAGSLPELRRAVAVGIMLLGFSLAFGAETALARVIVIILPAIAGLAIWSRPIVAKARLVVWLAATLLLGTAAVIALFPNALSKKEFCTLSDGPLGGCVLVAVGGDSEWTASTWVSPGAVVLVKAEFKASGTQSDDTTLELVDSRYFRWIDGSLRSSIDGEWELSNGKAGPLALNSPGVNFGSYSPGGAIYVNFALQLAGQDAFECGSTEVPIRIQGSSSSGESAAEAKLTVKRSC